VNSQKELQMSKDVAKLFWSVAVEFYEAYLVVDQDETKRHDLTAMKHYLIGHALEVTLKGWLLDTGEYTVKQLKSGEFKNGHDLALLAQKVKSVYGQSRELDYSTALINVINEDYRGKGYEYPINGGTFRGTTALKEFHQELKNYIDKLIASILSNTYPNKALPLD
jgi:hypothetical protein